MTIKYQADVFCDHCGNWIHGVVSDKTSRIAEMSLSVAKKAGWSRSTRSMYLDLCPYCVAKERKGELSEHLHSDVQKVR